MSNVKTLALPQRQAALHAASQQQQAGLLEAAPTTGDYQQWARPFIWRVSVLTDCTIAAVCCDANVAGHTACSIMQMRLMGRVLLVLPDLLLTT